MYGGGGTGASDRCSGCDAGNIGCEMGKWFCEVTGVASDSFNNCFGMKINCGYLIIGVLAIVLILQLRL
jgi:hypothetical protein